jgi:methyltransferase (TIGR00027 family)
MRLTDVSKTAIATLRCRAIESEKRNPLIHDPMAVYCVERLSELASEDERVLLFDRKLLTSLTSHIALRARKYDAIANEFISNNAGCLVVNLGCGFDTRYWRINHDACEYVELDLPELIELKREVLKGRLDYDMMGVSVLDRAWMDAVNPDGKRKALLLAEGLFMYLPKPEVISLFRDISERFRDSKLVFEVVTEQYTRGIWKKLVVTKMKRQLGYDAGSSYQFGIRNAREVESYGEGLKVIGEWSYADGPDVRPKILKYLGLRRKQWTVTVGVNES